MIQRRPGIGGLSSKSLASPLQPSAGIRGIVPEANRLYILTVKRRSLLTKKKALEAKLYEVRQQLTHLQKEMRISERRYLNLNKQLAGRRKRVKKHVTASSGELSIEF